MAESSDVSRSTPAFRLWWDVFLSFRGEDIRHGFTDLLYTELDRKGVRAFRDNDVLNKGDEIASGLLEAIEDSAAAIVIISPNYASSRWCLEELATICDCGRLILPVFYSVDPSNVRRQRGPFESGFRDLESRFKDHEVTRWRNAMEKAGGRVGWVIQKKEEHESLIQLLVRRILDELSNTPMGMASYTVGLDSRVEDLMRLLDLKSNGIQVWGFHGMGGVGKTTLAKALYNKLVSQFEHRSFISDVREASMHPNGLVSLQRKLLGDLSLGKASGVNDVSAGKVAIKGILNDKRVLVVLDDVDDVSQLGALAIRREWFYEGSRIIITTRDRNVLPADHVNKIYEVKGLGFSDSLKLFRYHASGSKKSSQAFLKLSEQIVSLTGGLPLALEVFGSFLFDKRRVEEWEDALQKLKQIRPYHLHDILKISFDRLNDEEKCIFLDIACLFDNLRMTRDNAVDILKGCGFRAEIAINVLVARSLIKFVGFNTLWMHDQVRDMGRQIVHLENLVDPGMRSRLWNPSEILNVLKERMGTRHVQGIILDSENFPKETFHHDSKKDGEIILRTEAFQSMACLRLLQLSNVQLEGNFKCLPPELKWLQWRKCPLKNLPSSFCLQKLTVLDLSESKIESIWGRKWSGWFSNEVWDSIVM